MKLKNLIYKNAMWILASGIVFAACQKITHPALGNYPKDSNPVGGPLKFYTAFESTDVDSIRANFGTDNNVNYSDGASGKAYHGSETSFIQYSTPNDFGSVTSFTIAF